jgi:ArsR family transcriptional regulator
MKTFKNILKALADEKRARILKLVSVKKLCVCELADILGVTQPAVSRHLKKLRSAGLIGCEQDGFWTNYFMVKPKDKRVKSLVECVGKWLNDEELVKRDARKAMKTNRKKLCCNSHGEIK